MDKDVFILVPFPHSQAYIGRKDFEYNSALCNTEPLVSMVGSNAYFIRRKWLEELDDE